MRESLYNNYIFPQSQQQTQATDIQEEEIRMGINLPYVKVFSEKLQLKLGTHRTRFIFDTENTLRKLVVHLKIEWLQKMKRKSFWKLTLVTVE